MSEAYSYHLRALDEILNSLERRYERRRKRYELTGKPEDWARLDEARLALNQAIQWDRWAREMSSTRGDE